MKLVITILLLVVCFVGYSTGFDYDEDDIRTLVKRQANYYNNYDYYGGTTTVATTKKKLIKKCPTNAAGNRIKCKKKKKKTTTTTTEAPIGIPSSFLRGPPGINPISFFIGPGSWYTQPEPTNSTIMSTSTTTSRPSNTTIPRTKFGGNFVGLPMITGGMLPTGSPKNSSFSHMPAHFEPGHNLNLSHPFEHTKLSPAGAMQFGVLPKMMKSYNSTIPTNVDPIVSGSMVDTTTPQSLTGLMSKVGSLVAPIASSGFSISSLNFFLPNDYLSPPQNTTTTAKPAGLSNVTNTISNTTIAPTTMILPGLRDLLIPSITNSTTVIPAVTTTFAPSSTTSSSGIGTSLGKIILSPGFPIPGTNRTVGLPRILNTTILPVTASTSVPSLTTASSNLGSLIGKVGVPIGIVTTTVIPLTTSQTVLPSTTTAVSTSKSKTGSGLPTLGVSAGQSTTVSSTTTSLPSSTTPKLGLLLPLLPGGSVSGTTTSLPSSTTPKLGLLISTTVSAAMSTTTTKNPLTTNDITVTATTIFKGNITLPSTATTLKNLATTIGSAVNGTSTTKSTASTPKNFSKTTKKKGRKNKKLRKKKKQQSKKTTKKAENQQGNKESENVGKKQD